MDENGEKRTERLELWQRNPVDCIKELISNPAFAEYMRYAPEHHFEDPNSKKPLYSEIWSANWWHDI